MQILSSKSIENKILQDDFRKSQNFFESDQILKHYLKKNCSVEGFAYMKNNLVQLGHLAATKMDALSLTADQNGPVLKKRNALGEDINEITFHPSYESLKKIAVDSEMFRVKWDRHA